MATNPWIGRRQSIGIGRETSRGVGVDPTYWLNALSFSFADDDLYLIAPDKFVLRLATKDQIIAEPNGAVTLGYDGFDTLLTRRGGITLRNTDNDDTEIFTGQDVANLGDLVLYSPNIYYISHPE